MKLMWASFSGSMAIAVGSLAHQMLFGMPFPLTVGCLAAALILLGLYLVLALRYRKKRRQTEGKDISLPPPPGIRRQRLRDEP